MIGAGVSLVRGGPVLQPFPTAGAARLHVLRVRHISAVLHAISHRGFIGLELLRVVHRVGEHRVRLHLDTSLVGIRMLLLALLRAVIAFRHIA